MERERRPVFRASLGEIVGSWLRVWAPRRDVYIPPVPVFRLVLAAVVLVGAIVVTTVLVENGKEAGRERDRRAEAVAVAQIRARIARDQLPRRARLGVPAASRVRTQHG